VTPSDRRLLSLVFLSCGVLVTFGNLSSVALVCVLLSLGLAIQSLSGKPWGPAPPRWAGTVVVVGLGATSVLYDKKVDHQVFLAAFIVLAGAVVLYSLARARVARILAFALAAASATIGIVANMTWGNADIDVFHFQQTAAQALLNGQSPYSPVVRSPAMVAPGVAAYLHLHFPYGPILPVLEAPFRLLGDIRVLHILAALTTSVAVLVLARRAGTLDRAACVVMAFPLTAGMVLFSWVDVITMASLAVWFVSFRSHPRVATIALAVALGAKPTTLIALVPMFFWSIRARRQMLIATVVAALFVLPFALVTGLSQFYYNVLGVQLAVFPRLDALTINSFLHSITLPILPFTVSGLAIAAATVLVLRRRPNSYGDLLTGTAILATVSFLVAKWAYFNYYYIPAVLLMMAIAGGNLPVDVPEMIRPPVAFLRCVELMRRARKHLPWSANPPAARIPGRDRPHPVA
jgi:hypothetical protein